MRLQVFAAPAVIGTAALVLLLCRLDNGRLWQDEAETALLARSVLLHGEPLAFDGRNLIAQEQGVEYDDHYRWKWHPWLPFYVVAASFYAFGESTFSARLPFALLGAATIVGTYILGRLAWKETAAAAWSAIVLTLCVPFLILSRQCRYYSLSAFLGVLVLIAYFRWIHRKRFGAPLLFSAVVLLFYTNFACVYTFLGGLGLHFLIWQRNRWRELAGWLMLAALVCLPGAIWFSGSVYLARYGSTMFHGAAYWQYFHSYMNQIRTYCAPFLLLEVPVICICLHALRGTPQECRDRPLWRDTSCLALVALSHLVMIPLVVPAPFFRYLVAILPVMALLIGRIVTAAFQWHWGFGVAVLGLALVRPECLDYGDELLHPFRGPVDGIVEYLSAHGTSDELVVVTYEDLPVKFYTNLRVMGGLTGEDLSAARPPDWIIVRKNVVGAEKEAAVREFIDQEIERGQYEQIVLDVPDTRWQNREDPAEHLYRTSDVPDRVVLRRRRGGGQK